MTGACRARQLIEAFFYIADALDLSFKWLSYDFFEEKVLSAVDYIPQYVHPIELRCTFANLVYDIGLNMRIFEVALFLKPSHNQQNLEKL